MSIKVDRSFRKDIKDLLNAKADKVLKALGTEISTDLELIRQRLMEQAGYSMSSNELSVVLNDLNTQKSMLVEELDNSGVLADIDGLYTEKEFNVNQSLQDLNEEEGSQLDELKLEFEQKKAALKNWVEESKANIASQFVERTEALKQSLESLKGERESAKVSAVEKFIQDKAPDLIDSIEGTERSLKDIRSKELEFMTEARRRSEVTRKCQDRLQHIVEEAKIKALTDLMSIDDAAQGMALVDRIPNVSEIIHMIDNEENAAKAILERMQPEFRPMLAAPTAPAPEEAEVESNSTEVEVEADYVEVNVG